ncbi:MAG: hypothetical protein JWL79_128 [Frankiales bacterium]|jgi:hypothetical protein|nr:hypothetical protein [Frankiales bacterium]
MRVTTVLSPLQADTAERWAVARLAEWGLPTHMARLWIDSAAASFRPVADGEIILEYEAELGIVTCEMWSAGRRVFGLDDWVG